jgi:hypothetical protein
VPGKGRGLIAKVPINAGDLILVDDCALLVCKNNPFAMCAIWQTFTYTKHLVPASSRADLEFNDFDCAFYDMATIYGCPMMPSTTDIPKHWQEKCKSVMYTHKENEKAHGFALAMRSRIIANGFDSLIPGVDLLSIIGSLANHSCHYNIAMVPMMKHPTNFPVYTTAHANVPRVCMGFVAHKKIMPGEEILVAYSEPRELDHHIKLYHRAIPCNCDDHVDADNLVTWRGNKTTIQGFQLYKQYAAAYRIWQRKTREWLRTASVGDRAPALSKCVLIAELDREVENFYETMEEEQMSSSMQCEDFVMELLGHLLGSGGGSGAAMEK